MQFILLGFSQTGNVRRFRFQGVASDHSRSDFTVDADLLMVRKFSIATQELPLLCRRLLESRPELSGDHDITFTEQEMRVHAEAHALAVAEAAGKRKFRPRTPVRKPAGEDATGQEKPRTGMGFSPNFSRGGQFAPR